MKKKKMSRMFVGKSKNWMKGKKWIYKYKYIFGKFKSIFSFILPRILTETKIIKNKRKHIKWSMCIFGLLDEKKYTLSLWMSTCLLCCDITSIWICVNSFKLGTFSQRVNQFNRLDAFFSDTHIQHSTFQQVKLPKFNLTFTRMKIHRVPK